MDQCQEGSLYYNYNNLNYNESTKQRSNSNYNHVHDNFEFLQKNTNWSLPLSELNGSQYNANVGLEQEQNFATPLPTPYFNQSSISNIADYQQQIRTDFPPMLNEEICLSYNCHSCSKTLVYNESTKTEYCNDCVSHQAITEGQFLQDNLKELFSLSESSSKHQYNTALEQGQNSTAFSVTSYSNQPSPLSTSNFEGNQQTLSPSPPTSKRKRSSKNKDRKINDQAYIKSKNNIYITMARLIGIPLPYNFEFSREQSTKNKYWSIKGILQKVVEWIETSKRELKILKRENEELKAKVKII